MIRGILALAFLSGCAGRFEEARLSRPVSAPTTVQDRARCSALDDRRVLWGAIATGSTVLAGGAGLGTIPVDSQDVRIGIASAGVAIAVIGGVAIYVADRSGEAWVREGCGP